MMKIVIFLAAFTALAATAKLGTTPDQLHLIWETLHRDIESRRDEAEQEIHNLKVPLHVLAEEAKEQLSEEIHHANRHYYEEVEKLEEDARHSGHDISHCVNSVNHQLDELDEKLIKSLAHHVDDLDERAEVEVDKAIKHIIDSLDSLEDLRGRVQRCDEERCATELNIEVVEFYEVIIRQIDHAIAEANNAVLIELVKDLDTQGFHEREYQEDLEKLIRELHNCVENDSNDSNDSDEPRPAKIQ